MNDDPIIIILVDLRPPSSSITATTITTFSPEYCFATEADNVCC
jgi:hypothetical protein